MRMEINYNDEDQYTTASAFIKLFLDVFCEIPTFALGNFFVRGISNHSF